MGIIPGSMGVRSYIVRGKGNPESFCSCSHGAGRRMSRRQAEKQFTIEDHIKATEGVECKKDASVIDETPGDKAFLVNDGDKDYWLPKAMTENNGDGTFTIPEWLAIEKGIV
jgi:tRNA-splicing ligase RtcB